MTNFQTMRFHRSTERWITNVNHSEQVESQGAQNTAGGEHSEHATRLLTGGPPAVFDKSVTKQPKSKKSEIAKFGLLDVIY